MSNSKLPAWLPCILPLALFMVIPMITKALHLPYIAGYPISTGIVLAVELGLWKLGYFPELKMPIGLIPALFILGVILCVLWFAVDRFTPHFAFLGSRAAFNPFQEISDPRIVYAFLTIRFAGLVIAAPIAEELFYRSFLLRYIINPSDFKCVGIGKYDLAACIAVVVMMAGTHPEWLAAAIFSLAMNLVVYKTKSVGACVFTHGVTNLALGLWVIHTQQWVYW